METEMNRSRIVIILLFAIAFTLIGWLAPVMYATYVPQDRVIEQHSFTAENTTITADSHELYFDRTVHQPAAGEMYTQLYVVNDNGHRIEIDASSSDHYFEEGRTNVVSSQKLPDNLEPGTYRYILVVKLDMVEGRVERTFTFESETFIISNETAS